MSLAHAAPVAGAILPLLVLSCAAPPPPPQAPAATQPQATTPGPPLPDLARLPDPPTLVLSGRIAKPSASLSILRAWTSLPLPQPDDVTEMVMGEPAGPLVDLDQPIDFAIALTGVGLSTRGRSAVSLALKNVDAAKTSLSTHYALVPAENGVLLLQRLSRPERREGDEDDRADADRRACEIAPAYGAAPVRLVCGWSAQALSDLAPWLTRTATRATTDSDVRVDLRMRPLHSVISAGRRFIGSLVASSVAGHMANAHELAFTVAGDLADFALDLDAASLDVLLREPALGANATLRFVGRASALTRLATAHPERGGAAPEAFWRMPADSDFAFFERGLDEAELAPARDVVLRMLGRDLDEGGIKEADRNAILDALGKVISFAPLVYASGLDTDAVRKATAAEATLRDTSSAPTMAEAKRASAEALFGWRMIEIDEPAGRLSGVLKELSSVWDRKEIATAYRANAAGTLPPALRAAPMPKGVSLPPGSEHHLIELYPVEASSPSTGAPGGKAHAGASKPVVLHAFVVPEGGRTWLGIGGGEPLIASKLSAAVRSTGDALGGRAELASLQGESVGCAGFFSVRGLAGAALELARLTGHSGQEGAEQLDEVERLPHRGVIPVAFSLTAHPDVAPAVAVASLTVPRAAIEDIIAAVLRHGF
jgi:hypothetical protein